MTVCFCFVFFKESAYTNLANLYCSVNKAMLDEAGLSSISLEGPLIVAYVSLHVSLKRELFSVPVFM